MTLIKDTKATPPPSISEERDKTYFGYYGMLMHQQNMLLDSIRTSTYHGSITGNPEDFADKVVLDVGAGTGILSFFAVKAGARKVYAVEASEMAIQTQKLVDKNGMQDKIIVIKGRIEEIELPEPVDVIISEPMGVMLVHERMMESFIIGRNRFLRPDLRDLSIQPSQMFPSSGLIYLAPFSDINLFADAVQKIGFWNNHNFYGVDLTCLVGPSANSQFSQIIVGPIDPKTLLSQPTSYVFDFTTISVGNLYSFSIPFKFAVGAIGIIHGLAGWFDVIFAGSQSTKVLSTSPMSETTHWYQTRFLFHQPIAVNRGQVLSGKMDFCANDQRSHDILLEVHLEGTDVTIKQQFAMQDQQYWNLAGDHGNISKECLGIYGDNINF